MTLQQAKNDIANLDASTVIGISALDTSKNVSVTAYSIQTMNMQTKNDISDMIKKAVRENKLKSYNMPGLQKIMKNLNASGSFDTYKIDSETGKATSSEAGLNMIIGYGASFLIYMFILMFSGMVMQSSMEEKSNRIVEVLVSSVKPFQLMLGKIIGIALVGLTQFMIWILLTGGLIIGIASFAGSGNTQKLAEAQKTMVQNVPAGSQISAQATATIQQATSGDKANDIKEKIFSAIQSINITEIIICFFIFFILGYLLYSSMFAAIGASVENQADTQQLTLPVTAPLIIGLFIMLNAFQYPDSSLSFWGSIIPFTSPMVMMARISYGVPFWQLALSVGLLIATFLFITYIASKIFRVGILMYGKKPSWKDLWKWIKY
jgi:ABC-2 type transport system permease protein